MNAPLRALEAERTVLGAVLVDPTVWHAVADRLQPGDFADARHRAAWAALSRLALAEKPLDLVTLKDALHATDDLATAGGPAYLAGLLDGVPRFAEAGVLAWAGRRAARGPRLPHAHGPHVRPGPGRPHGGRVRSGCAR